MPLSSPPCFCLPPYLRDVRRSQSIPIAEAEPICALCGRIIPHGAKSSLHHLTPKLKGGTHRGTVRLHQICHSAIHARYTEAEIARSLASPDLLQADPELARFVTWVRTKPDDFHAPTRRARQRAGKWR
jgi:5-methylcytosine-specific restriction protein A